MRHLVIALVLCGLSVATVQAVPLPNEVEAEFDTWDRNEDEVLDRSELSKILPRFGGGYNSLSKGIFRWFDADENQEIDLDEWTAGRTDPDFREPPDLTGFASRELDKNRNGLVSWREFRKAIKRFVPRSTMRDWYAAQFGEDEEVTNSSGSYSVTGSTLIWGTSHAGTGTLTLNGTSNLTSSPGTDSGISSQWAVISPPETTAWLAAQSEPIVTSRLGVPMTSGGTTGSLATEAAMPTLATEPAVPVLTYSLIGEPLWILNSESFWIWSGTFTNIITYAGSGTILMATGVAVPTAVNGAP